MNYEKTQVEHGYEQLAISSQRIFPSSPFPRKHVHCVFDDLHHVVQAVFALRADGHDARNIHVMSCWDYVEAVERKRQSQGCLSKALTRLLTLMDEGFGDTYLREAMRGGHILMVRLSNNKQKERVRDLLALHYGYRMKYVDAWTVIDLLPPPEHPV